MHVHTTARAALLLTASLALAGGYAPADAASHHAAPTRATHARSARALHVTLTTRKDSVRISKSTIRPGNTYLDVVHGNAGGSLEMLRLRPGYSFRHAMKDFPGLFSGDTAAIKRVDKNVIFYGGLAAIPKVTQTFATRLDAGKYYVLNIGQLMSGKRNVGILHVQGAMQKRPLPKATSHVNWVGEESFSTNSTIGHAGWLRQTNLTHQPHFMDLGQVRKSTTKKQVQDYIDSHSQDPPSFALSRDISTEVVSPGHTVLWNYHTARGRYLEACFYPDKKTGAPHFFMGMWHLVNLT